ncbi:DUF5605 domain-containing protein [Maribacter sp. TH_r10]|uniref:DUF5060 domain-containing protein n=1 Tax=Maribacter sp. TH_r10 TaxID=3082086 RepID=UPI0029552280|nr:DUF5060 domain-containing protein [Maribacter sp. TH_r10]MDV7138191.1 DUF5605 domain-containing protein [Maribacter sp. TH_r10]
MKISKILIAGLLFVLSETAVFSQEKVEQWNRFEIGLNHRIQGNGFTDVELRAKFYNADTTFLINGFYDGDNTYKIRFMPQEIGRWNYTITSNIKEFDNKKGYIECVRATGENHGIVRVADTYHFKYADGKQYYPFGTTAYAWIHMGEELQEITLETLKKSGFNKVRMCVFPKSYKLVHEEPLRYPFKIKKMTQDEEGNKVFLWDFERFDPEFFQHLEKRIDELSAQGIQADLILFHPYDKGRWGFDSMSEKMDVRYLEYITTRLASFKNVWWSIANEWKFLKSKSVADWDALIETVGKNDPYGHLCSIHGPTSVYYDYTKPGLTHVSIQDEAPVLNSYSTATLRNIYKKPIVLDEVGYEGNLSQRWGRLSPEKMTNMVWNGVISGGYVTHGETYMYGGEKDTIFWADGGSLKGSSWKRISFLRNILEDAPGPLIMSDISRDLKTSSAGKGYYLVYFGEEMNESWIFSLPIKNGDKKRLQPGAKFKVDIIDAWDMTITADPQIFETRKVDGYRVFDKDMKEVRLPLKPYIALRITETD